MAHTGLGTARGPVCRREMAEIRARFEAGHGGGGERSRRSLFRSPRVAPTNSLSVLRSNKRFPSRLPTGTRLAAIPVVWAESANASANGASDPSCGCATPTTKVVGATRGMLRSLPARSAKRRSSSSSGAASGRCPTSIACTSSKARLASSERAAENHEVVGVTHHLVARLGHQVVQTGSDRCC